MATSEVSGVAELVSSRLALDPAALFDKIVLIFIHVNFDLMFSSLF